ncbi:MAG TPA: hypothetical protein VK919_09950 [Solirubrobacterales bacterium]|nr:hypothetical protein [Solirubrobacterales bacterium]
MRSVISSGALAHRYRDWLADGLARGHPNRAIGADVPDCAHRARGKRSAGSVDWILVRRR